MFELVHSPVAVGRVFAATSATLVHGHLSPENVAINGDTVTLLDWGSLTMWAPRSLDAAGIFLSFPLRRGSRESRRALRNHAEGLIFETRLRDRAPCRVFDDCTAARIRGGVSRFADRTNSRGVMPWLVGYQTP